MKRNSSPLVSRVPATRTTGPAADASGVIEAGGVNSPVRPGPKPEFVRARASICCTVAGCDQRVGKFGFET